ncbi:hypothetical protein L228DRAFT_236715 [Xylona heveae TC161]|uniref:AHC1-like C2H2 zinc-finger domain-containing protein n=1 Tax=Xylona heveae (strain CBS 132557 / TC161) TaxID=1328760 RepID=A0A165J2D9_XYLHT|nr:hypothetical protein L228DRAFT_236715 [Xylona heveae TC161]KZF25640.1 hypothetical protein L228DRAFT_236715 [Xylona heveae TC161]
MFRLPWISGGDKVDPVVEPVSIPTAQRKPVVEIPVLKKFKRKRSESPETQKAQLLQSPTKRRQASDLDSATSQRCDNCPRRTNGVKRENGGEPNGLASSEPGEKGHFGSEPLVTKDPLSVTQLQQAIEAEFSLEILLKHNELRLIDQELAKCQVALEQLRRCRIIPYPTFSTNTNAKAVSDGVGPALTPSPYDLTPQYPPPWGVADGPYTRHYAKWLIPDPAFGDYTNEFPFPGSTLPSQTALDSRITRGSFNEGNVGGKSSRSQRGSAGAKLQALSNATVQPREKAGPLVVKRASDGKHVKLVCLDCERADFSSAQGFINHCRIAHHRGFESHDAAAVACGQVVDIDDAGVIVGGSEPSKGGGGSLVHPLIKTAPATKLSAKEAQALSRVSGRNGLNRTAVKAADERANGSTQAGDSSTTPAKTQKKRYAHTPTPNRSNSDSPFVPSPQTPHLSALMQQKGFGGDLGEMVGQAKTQVDFNVYTMSDEEENEPPSNERTPNKSQRRQFYGGFDGVCDEDDDSSVPNGTRVPARAGMSPATYGRPASHKGPDKPTRKPESLSCISPRQTYAAPLNLRDSANPAESSSHVIKNGEHESMIMFDGPPPMNVSPHTVESNHAPSLVSDDGEYEAHSESESPSSAEADDEDGFLDVLDQEDGACGSETTATDPELATGSKAMPPRRTSNLRDRVPRGNADERHVTFLSPSRDVKKRSSRNAGSKS